MEPVSILLLLMFVTVVVIVMFVVSSYIAFVVLVGVPVLSALVFPIKMYSFIHTKQGSLWGLDVYTLHLLLAVWCGLLGVLIYSELIAWYLKRVGTERGTERDVVEDVEKEVESGTDGI
ncbi:MAG: hypothetical protein ACXQS2_04280 [Methermicoccaceae archaeon]